VYTLVTFIELLRQVKGANAGGLLRLDPFQVFILYAFFGPQNPDTGTRLVRTGLLTMGRKNAKTTLVAALLTALMALDPDHGGLYRQELFVGASDREQAGETYDAVSGFITQDEDLGIFDIFKMTESKKMVLNTITLTKLKVLSSEAYRAHGRNPRVLVFDEIGNVPAGGARDFYSVLTTGFGAQKEPFIALMSTQAPSDTHIFSEMVDLCAAVNSGGGSEDSVDTAGFVFYCPERIGDLEVDPFDPGWWHLGNPGVGTICLTSDLEEQARKAQSLPSFRAKFLNLRLNRRENPFSPLLSKTVWADCGGEERQLEDFAGCRVYLGLDLSSVTDLTSLVVTVDPDDGGQWPVYAFFWSPGTGLAERAKTDKVPYDVWAAQGHLNVESGVTIDYRLVTETLLWITENFQVQALAYDRWRMKDVLAKLEDAGFDKWDSQDKEQVLFPVGQGYKDATPCVDVLEQRALAKTISHDGNPVLTWCLANAVIERDPAGNRKFHKAKSYGRIDGAVALSLSLRAVELVRNTEDETVDVAAVFM
ncbi:MAG: terminase TerL endonuclease subunit, partial [Acidimicrobiia bacterium]